MVDEAVTLKADAETAKAIEPGEKAFNLPAMSGDFPVGVKEAHRASSGGNAVADAACGEVRAKGDAVVATVGGQTGGPHPGTTTPPGHTDGGQSGQRRSQFVHGGAVEMESQRNTLAVHDDVAFAAYSRPRAADFVAPFFALT